MISRQDRHDGPANLSVVRLPIALVAVLLVALPAPASARQVEGLTITPPGASKTFDAIPGTNPLYSVVPPTYEECRDDSPLFAPSCDFIPIHFDAGRPDGYALTLTVTWPGASSNDLDVVLWNRDVRESECYALDPRDRFCGSEARSFSPSAPEQVRVFDLPAGEYVLSVINRRGANRGYTVSWIVDVL
jgi:hypothetical protein